MSRVKMVLMVALLLATAATTVATFAPRNTMVAQAQGCPAPDERIGACHTNEGDPNFSMCGRAWDYDPTSNYVPVCHENDCSYTDQHGNTISGTCCGGGACYKDPTDE
jgi:hypothetical protein